MKARFCSVVADGTQLLFPASIPSHQWLGYFQSSLSGLGPEALAIFSGVEEAVNHRPVIPVRLIHRLNPLHI